MTSTERTAPPRSTHVRDGRRLLLLDPARGKERLRKIQHDGVVVDAAELRQGFAKQLREEEEVLQGGGRSQGIRVGLLLLFPTIYRSKGEGEAQPLPLPPRKGAAKGGEESILPKAPRRCLPLVGLSPFFSLLVHGPLGAGSPWPKQAKAHPLRPMWPTKVGGPTRWNPGPLRWSRYNTDNTETCPDGQNSTSYI